MKIIYILFIVLILIFYLSNLPKFFEGNWESTDEFINDSGTAIFLNISGWFKTKCKFIFIKDDITSIVDGTMFFYSYNPLALLNYKSSGYVNIKFDSPIFDKMPKKIYYDYDPSGKLVLYKDKVYGSFIKLH